MQALINKTIQEITGTSNFREQELIQTLWSGYGKLLRYKVDDANIKSLVVKHVQVPEQTKHPRGWSSSLSQQRKMKSYQVEQIFYTDYAKRCNESTRIPHCYSSFGNNNEMVIIMEDLDSSGYGARLHSLSWNQIKVCISWLANFHAQFMGEEPKGLWEVGCYWHLDTRPHEWEVMKKLELKNKAKEIDAMLSSCRFKTLVHGDAKLANFCFATDGSKVAAVDFQYVGGGCGMKDLAYFVSSCMYEEECEAKELEILDFYFAELKKALGDNYLSFAELEKEWRMMYHFAWADFARFLDGWSPAHWKVNSYTNRVCGKVLSKL